MLITCQYFKALASDEDEVIYEYSEAQIISQLWEFVSSHSCHRVEQNMHIRRRDAAKRGHSAGSEWDYEK